jgi:hypothetical protein
MLLYIHGKFTVGCRYCLNVAIDTWKVYNGMQVLPEWAVPASHCELSVYV